MSRHKALAALAFLGVLISAGSVGSQDPFRARAEAESAATATPIAPSDNQFAPAYDPLQPPPASAIAEPVAEGPPISITPEPSAIARESAPAPQSGPAPVAATSAPFQLALATTASRASAATVPQTPTPKSVVEPAAQLVRTSLPADRVTAPTQFADIQEPGAPLFASAQRRLFATVPDEIEGYFDLYMYVSKSDRGPFAQRMFVFQRDADGKIIPYAEWRVSTGREKIVLHHDRKVRTTTPEGMFALDPDRLYARYWSKSWDGAPMHYAMFYDLMNNGNQSGLAIHAAVGADKIRRLGRRDSAGCIRLAPKQAKELFYKIRNTTKGQVPAFAVNERGSTDRWGRVEHDAAGAIMLQDGYRAVLYVENYDGRDEVMGPVVAYTN